MASEFTEEHITQIVNEVGPDVLTNHATILDNKDFVQTLAYTYELNGLEMSITREEEEKLTYVYFPLSARVENLLTLVRKKGAQFYQIVKYALAQTQQIECLKCFERAEEKICPEIQRARMATNGQEPVIVSKKRKWKLAEDKVDGLSGLSPRQKSPKLSYNTNSDSPPKGKHLTRQELQKLSPVKKMKDIVLGDGHCPDKPEDGRIEFSKFISLRMVSDVEHENYQDDKLVKNSKRFNKYLCKEEAEELNAEDLLKMIKPNKVLMIQGRAGVGKSTFIQERTYAWASGSWAEHLKCVFLLRVRDFTSCPRREVTLDVVLKERALYRCPELDLSWLQKNQKNILFFVDGIDEYPQILNDITYVSKLEEQSQAEPIFWLVSFLRGDILKAATYIFASRPFESLRMLNLDPVIEVIGLTRAHVFKFIETYVRPDRVSKVKAVLQHNRVLLSICTITFFCKKLCQIFEESDAAVPEDLTTYTRICSFIVQRCSSRSALGGRCSSTSLTSDARLCLKALAKLAFNGLFQKKGTDLEKLLFSSEDLKEASLDPEQLEKANATGLLQSSGTGEFETKEFIHLSVQEMLSVAHLLSQPASKIRKAFNELLTKGHLSMAQLYLLGLRYDQHNLYNRNMCHALDVPSRPNGRDPIIEVLQKYKAKDNHMRLVQLLYETQSEAVVRQVATHVFTTSVMTIKGTITAVEVKAMEFVISNSSSKIQQLVLEDLRMDEVSQVYLGDFLEKDSCLKGISFSRTSLEDSALQQLLQALQKNSCLEKLEFKQMKMKQGGHMHVADFISKNKRIKHLCLQEKTKFSKQAVAKLLDALATNVQLESFDFDAKLDVNQKRQLSEVILNRTSPLFVKGFTGCICLPDKPKRRLEFDGFGTKNLFLSLHCHLADLPVFVEHNPNLLRSCPRKVYIITKAMADPPIQDKHVWNDILMQAVTHNQDPNARNHIEEVIIESGEKSDMNQLLLAVLEGLPTLIGGVGGIGLGAIHMKGGNINAKDVIRWWNLLQSKEDFNVSSGADGVVRVVGEGETKLSLRLQNLVIDGDITDWVRNNMPWLLKENKTVS